MDINQHLKKVKQKLRKKRKKIWDTLFEKYTDTETDSSSTQTLINKETEDSINFRKQQDYQKIINYIEIELQSDLRNLLITRLCYKILESSQYVYWHEKTKDELDRLETLISHEDLKFYCKYISTQVMETKFDTEAKNLLTKSSLKSLLWERETLRSIPKSKSKWILICKKIKMEWKKYARYVPTEYFIKYAANAIKDFNFSQYKS